MRVRWTQHRSHARRGNGANFKLYEAMRQFGVENFVMVEIDHAANLEEAKSLEISYIKLFNTMNSEHGYNGNSGGQGHEISEETRRKLSEANSGEKNPHFGERGPLSASFGLKRSAETRALQSQRKKELVAAGWKPKPLPPEVRERIRLASVGLKRSDETRAKQRALKLGKPLSEEHKQKLREAQAICKEKGIGVHNPIYREKAARTNKEHGTGLWNPEVRAKGRHTRWHVNKGVVDSNCKWCIAPVAA